VSLTRRTVQIATPVVGDEEWEALREPLREGWLTQGRQVAAFEREFAARHGVAHAVAVTSCTTGLHLALAALGIGPGDEVIVPAFTWVATANAVLYCGATPVFCDVDEATYNIDVASIGELLSTRTRAIVPVHLFGLCADVDALRDAVGPGVAIVEDAACAAGATYHGRSAGGLGDVAVFSFHPRKSITTGEGGMLTTDDAEVAERAVRLRNHGASLSEEMRHRGPQPYMLPAFEEMGFNYRMTDLQGAVGRVQLGRLDGFLAERRRMAARYDSLLADVAWLSTPRVPAGLGHGWQSYVCRVEPASAPAPRNLLMQQLLDMGVSTRPGTHCVTELDFYRARFGTGGRFPRAASLEQTTLAIPLHNAMDDGDLEHVVAALRAL